MSEVKRYDLIGDMDGNCNLNEARMELSDDGVYVMHHDYEAIQAKCAQLAAENAVLKDCLAPIGLKVEWTPTTDAYLDEVRAQVVEMFADHLLCPDLDDTIRDFASQLRKGGNQ